MTRLSIGMPRNRMLRDGLWQRAGRWCRDGPVVRWMLVRHMVGRNGRTGWRGLSDGGGPGGRTGLRMVALTGMLSAGIMRPVGHR